MTWAKKAPGVGAIMSNWKTGQAPNPKQKTAVILAEKKKASGGVAGLMAARNDLKSMRTSTLPKGFKK